MQAPTTSAVQGAAATGTTTKKRRRDSAVAPELPPVKRVRFAEGTVFERPHKVSVNYTAARHDGLLADADLHVHVHVCHV